MGEHERRIGPTSITWDPDTRLAEVAFVEPGVGGRAEAEELARQLDEWALSPTRAPFRILYDCSDILDGDAGWRAVFGEWFRERRDVATIAWCNANPRVRLLILMFRKGTGVHGRAFATRDEALAWLTAQPAGASRAS